MQRITLAKSLLLLCLLAFSPLLQMDTRADDADTSKDLTVTAIKDAPSFAKRALVIGIAHYEQARPLTVPPNDAHDFAKQLETGFGFPKESIILMTDDPETPDRLRPTLAHLRSQINALLASVDEKSEVVLFFSGHGARLEDQDWLVPLDGDPDDIAESCISYDKIKQKLDTKRPHRALLVVDACRNLRGGKDASPSGFGVASQLALGPQIAELLSCQPTEVSQEGRAEDFNESVFTHFLLAGLRGDPDALAAGTNLVTFDSLRLYVHGKVSQYVQSKLGSKQNPDGRATLGSMVLANIDKTAPPIETNSAAQFFQRAEKLFTEKKNEEAESAYREAVLLEPDNAVYQGKLSLVLLRLKKYDDAEAAARAAVRKAPDNAEYLEHLGDALVGLKRYSDAEAAYREAVRLEPKNAGYQNNLGSTLGKQGKEIESEPFFREAVRLEPTNAKYQYNLGIALGKQGKDVEAEPFFREAVRLEPKSALYQDNLGIVFYSQQKYVEAESFYREAVRLEPTNALYQDRVGFVLGKQGRDAEAEPFFREAVRLEPVNAMYKTHLDTCLKHIH